MLSRLKCFIGLHDFQIVDELHVPGNGPTAETPEDFVLGGIDYTLECKHCRLRWIEQKRGVWITLPYPRVC